MKPRRAWLWNWQEEGCEFQHWLMMPAMDFAQSHRRGYRVLCVIFPFNYVVRAFWLAKGWLWRRCRFGSLEAWVRYKRSCPHCGRPFLAYREYDLWRRR